MTTRLNTHRRPLASVTLLSLGLAGVAFAAGQTPPPAPPAPPTPPAWTGDCGPEGADVRCEVIMERVGARPVIGAVLAPNRERGVLIAGVTPDGPASAVGLRSGDVLLAVDGKAITGQDADARLAQARTLLAGVKAGTPVALRYARGQANAEVRVTPRVDARVMIFRDGNVMRPDGNVVIRTTPDGKTMEMDRVTLVRVQPGDAPPAIIEAFRWNGLNLASVDAKLGRYFGTDRGVLVLSTMPAFEALEPGDVIRRVDGKDVATPREVMDALRGKPEQSDVPVEFLRDRTTRTARLTVPKAPPIPLAPPAPPAPPVPPPPGAPRGVMTPPPPPAPGAEGRTQQRRVITVVRDGKTLTWEDDGTGPLPPEFTPPPPPPAPPAPPAAPARVD